MPIAKCVEQCWDGVRCRLYYPGDQDDIDPMSPISMYFEFIDPFDGPRYKKPKPVKKQRSAVTPG